MVRYIDIGGYRVPVYSQDAFNFTPATRERNDFGEMTDIAPARYDFKGNETGTGYESDSWYNPANWQTFGEMGQMDPSQGFTGTLKSADKEGAQFRYTLKDGEYVPEYIGQTEWDTNPSDRNRFLAAAGLIAGGGMLANAYGIGAGSGTMGGFGAADAVVGNALGSQATAGIGSAGLGGAGLGDLSGFDAPGPNPYSGFGDPYHFDYPYESPISPPGTTPTNLGGFDAPGPTGAPTPNPLTKVGDFLNPSLIRAALPVLGGLLGGAGSGSGASTSPSGGRTPATNVPIPAIGGGGSSGGSSGFNGGLFNLGAQGNTQTEEMMRRYLPGLFGRG